MSILYSRLKSIATPQFWLSNGIAGSQIRIAGFCLFVFIVFSATPVVHAQNTSDDSVNESENSESAELDTAPIDPGSDDDVSEEPSSNNDGSNSNSESNNESDRSTGDAKDEGSKGGVPADTEIGGQEQESDSELSVFSKNLDTHGIACGEGKPCSVEATDLPLRALPRSFSPLYSEPNESSEPISNAVAAFRPMFVFDVQELDDRDASEIKGWYQLGYSQRTPVGWMQAKDVIEWRQALLLEYMHPGAGSSRRTPVVMFSELEALEDFVTTNGRQSRTKSLLDRISKGEIPDGVIGKEPERFLNIDDDFYLLPVVDWQREETFDEPSHYLQVVAAVPGARAETPGESTLEDEDYLKEDLFSGDVLADVVFVLDMTGSMAPYIQAVKDTVTSLVKKLNENEEDENPVKFGLVGYRDNIEASPDLNWDIKNFTPELLSATEFLTILDQAKAAKVSSDEWAENVHGGYLEGIESKWRLISETQKSIRLMLLVGDASGHDIADSARGYKNTTGRNAADLYELARRNGIFPFTIHLRDERAERDWSKAQAQFADFSFKQSDGNSFTFTTLTDEYAEENLSETAEYIGGRLTSLISDGIEALDGFASADSDPEAPTSTNSDGEQLIELARGIMQAATADFLGDGVSPPRDFMSWVHDYDLADSTREALSARVMINREDFDNIIRQTETLVDAIEFQTSGNVDFLVALKQIAAKTSLGLNLEAGTTLEDQEFLPKWVAALPYKSRVLALSPDEFANLETNERRQFLARLESKLSAYQEISSNTDLWLKLDENDDALQEVVALPLSQLP